MPQFLGGDMKLDLWNIMYKGLSFKDFISHEECDFLIKSAIENNAWNADTNPFWDDRVCNVSKLEENNFFKIKMSEILKKVKKTIINEYQLNNIYADTFDLIRWFENSSQPPHVDDMTNVDGDYDFFKHRKVATIIYLNDDFDGGETFYPQYDIKIKPEKGKLAIHLGDSNHLHGVTEIKNGTRYTLAGFWGVEKEYDNEF
jgi:hypothetical protein